MTHFLYPLVTASTEASSSALDHALDSGGVVFGVLILLIVLSVMSWFIIGYKTFGIWGAQRQSRSFIQQFRNATRLAELYRESEMFDASPARAMFRAGYMELNLLLKEREGGEKRPTGDGPAAAPATSIQAFENIERALQRAQRNAISQLEYALTFLATVGSAAPFIGLFGTVWGIMSSFQSIAESKNTSLAVVAPGIAEALFATALGLAAAIPAVVAYNKFAGDLERFGARLETFAQEFSTLLARQLDEGGQ